MNVKNVEKYVDKEIQMRTSFSLDKNLTMRKNYEAKTCKNIYETNIRIVETLIDVFLFIHQRGYHRRGETTKG